MYDIKKIKMLKNSFHKRLAGDCCGAKKILELRKEDNVLTWKI